jgi:DNA-binding transcriptional MocR family regulator
MPVNSFDNYPMSWKPQIENDSMPIYLAIADQLEKDIRKGILGPGTKLPPQRELADFLDVNLSTVSRAFKKCEQKGLICASVGSGTYVSSDVAVNTILLHHHDSHRLIELGSIFPDASANEEVGAYIKNMTAEPDFGRLFQYGLFGGTMWQKQAAVKWISKTGYQTQPQNILLANGGQNALFAVLAGLFHPGDKVGTDPITYPGIKAASKMLNIQLVPIQQENGEITAEGLLYAYKNENIKGIYLIPDFNNPTTHTMSQETRKMIATIAKDKGLIVIEDAINSLLTPNPLPPIASFAPENVLHITSLSKTVAPGLRLAFIVTPNAFRKPMEIALYGMNITVSPFMAELAARMIYDETAEKIVRKRRMYTREQNAIVDRCLNGYRILGHHDSNFRWLMLPERFTGESFELCAYHAGVQVYAAERFTVGKTKPERAIRMAITAPEDPLQLEEALEIIRGLLESSHDEATFY